MKKCENMIYDNDYILRQQIDIGFLQMQCTVKTYMLYHTKQDYIAALY